MSFIHDVIKIQYTREGYMENWPYHLLSDEEMCDAFIKLPDDIASYITPDYFGITASKTKNTVDWYQSFLNSSEFCYFKDNYPLVSESISSYYKDLVNRIFYEIQKFKNSLDADRFLPDWIYSYMLGIAIGPNSSKLDIHDMISSKAVGTDNIDDDYNLDCQIQCLRISKEWLKRLVVPEGDVQRPPTMFGEPHVLKYIRLFEESLTPEELSAS